jgi:hypothetical protein
MRHHADSTALAFRLGQLDAAQTMLLASPAHYSPKLRGFLALRQLTRIWAQYREDRAILTGDALIGAECAAARGAFLALLESIVSPDEPYLLEAIRLVRRTAIRPLTQERSAMAEIIDASAPILGKVIEALEKPSLPRDPLRRLEILLGQFGYSESIDDDPLTATALTPCWALNLAGAARSPAFGLSRKPLCIPGVVRRKMFRSDRDADQRRSDIAETLLTALHEALRDIALVLRADQAFAYEFTQQRSHSRLQSAWMLLYALGALTPAQLARALPATKAGTAKLLRQLVTAQMAQHHGAYDPYVCAIQFAVAFPAWGAEEAIELAAIEDDDDHIAALADIDD